MPTRKYHHKSTTGCAECKGARVKCDETRPACTRCSRQGRSCSYARQNSVPSPASSSGGVSGSSDEAVPIAHYLQDMELMHHYSIYACISLSQEDSIRHLWQHTAIKLALKYGFLLRTILAFSALHLSTTLPYVVDQQNISSPGPSQSSHADASPEAASASMPTPTSNAPPASPSNPPTASSDASTPTRMKWYERAVVDYGNALALARPELENITEKNCHAALVFSSLIAIIRMAMPRITGDYGPDGVLGYVLETFSLLRGKAAISDAAMPWVLRGPLRFAIADRELKQPREIPPPILAVLEKFADLAKTEAADSVSSGGDGSDPKTRLEGYMFAIAGLKAYFACQPGDAASVRISAAWSTRLAPSFMGDLKSHEPLALAVLAYYAVMLDDQREHWWVGDTGKQLLYQIAAVLGGNWASALSPAMEHMELDIDHWTQIMTLRLFDSADEDGGSPFVGLVNPQSLPQTSPGSAMQGVTSSGLISAPPTPQYSQNSPHVPKEEELDDAPVVQDSPFGVRLQTGELPGQTQTAKGPAP